MKEKIRKECYWRARTILKTEHNYANRVEAINTLAIPVVTYSFKAPTAWKAPASKSKVDVERMKHPSVAT